MAYEKRKSDILKPKMNPHIKDYADAYKIEFDDEYKEWGIGGYDFWQEYCYEDADDYFARSIDYDYYYDSNGVKLCSSTDTNRVRQEKLDILLGINKQPTIGDILPTIQ